jgi:hypothetical protein
MGLAEIASTSADRRSLPLAGIGMENDTGGRLYSALAQIA